MFDAVLCCAAYHMLPLLCCAVLCCLTVNPPNEDELFEALSTAKVSKAQDLPLIVRTGAALEGRLVVWLMRGAKQRLLLCW